MIDKTFQTELDATTRTPMKINKTIGVPNDPLVLPLVTLVNNSVHVESYNSFTNSS